MIVSSCEQKVFWPGVKAQSKSAVPSEMIPIFIAYTLVDFAGRAQTKILDGIL